MTESFDNSHSIKPPEGEAADVDFARTYLERTTSSSYLASILSTPESLITTKSKLSPFTSGLLNPRRVVSVGVGSGEELQGLSELLPPGVALYGLDLSPSALAFCREYLGKYDLKPNLVEGSAIDMPFRSNSVDGVVMSAILHEIYSYVASGKEAWKRGIRGVATILDEQGSFLLRDFESPKDGDSTVELQLRTDFSKDFYKYFRKYFRTFTAWPGQEVDEIEHRRTAEDSDFPQLLPDQDLIKLRLSDTAELALHFRNFYNDFSHGQTNFEDAGWKEINETYFVPDPNNSSITTMDKSRYIQAVIE